MYLTAFKMKLVVFRSLGQVMPSLSLSLIDVTDKKGKREKRRMMMIAPRGPGGERPTI